MYDYDLFVIGGGSGGIRAARTATQLGAKVALAESRYLGGTCVNVGCVPKKLFVYAAEFREEFALSEDFGWQGSKPSFNWSTLKANKNKAINRLNGIYKEVLSVAGTSLYHAHARILDPHHVEVEGKTFSTENILLATGGWPWLPEVPGIELAKNSNEMFFLEALPRSIVIVGGGYIAVEFTSIMHGLGVDTHLVYRGPLILRGFDDGLRKYLQQELQRKGIHLHLECNVEGLERADANQIAIKLSNGKRLSAGEVLYATGRRALTHDLGLENTQVKCRDNGTIIVDEHYRSAEPNVFALGDVTGGMELTPVALAEGAALANHLFGEPCPVDYRYIPTAIFSVPPMATVGMTEEKARQDLSALRIYETTFKPLRLSLGDSEGKVYMKLVVDAASDKVVGCHMAGENAGEIMQGLAIALRAGATKTVFDQTIGIHPTAAEEFVTLRNITRT